MRCNLRGTVTTRRSRTCTGSCSPDFWDIREGSSASPPRTWPPTRASRQPATWRGSAETARGSAAGPRPSPATARWTTCGACAPDRVRPRSRRRCSTCPAPRRGGRRLGPSGGRRVPCCPRHGPAQVPAHRTPRGLAFRTETRHRTLVENRTRGPGREPGPGRRGVRRGRVARPLRRDRGPRTRTASQRLCSAPVRGVRGPLVRIPGRRLAGPSRSPHHTPYSPQAGTASSSAFGHERSVPAKSPFGTPAKPEAGHSVHPPPPGDCRGGRRLTGRGRRPPLPER
ncbi:hypothetical protein SAMN05428939_5191 [Streptomyces sp. TLI_105]|nr:hypothetical protein SAMN05428939_5191 [Streptomyces sp. TLI_105]